MSIYSVALFFHILGAFGLMAALAVEDSALRGLRRATTGEQARTWLGAMRTLRVVAPASIALILVMGLYLTAAAWGWTGWIVSGLGALLLVGIIGGALTGRRMIRIGPAVGRAQGALSDDLRQMVLDPVLLVSARVRAGLVLGTLFLMSVKPSAAGSLVVLVIAVALGIAVSQVETRRSHELSHRGG
ncbi:MAG: hypothetical protein E6I88_01070 [Chloroflexi bacterium]|nr:MAG: hypothetical protein E6I88_01070 [Chloroflexota bacterium]TME48335.1 MAG: hypothetical protein E6I56_01740 [Chloroflexota bacterium]